MIYERKQNAPAVEGQEKDVLLVLDRQQGKVSAVKGFDKEGNLQTVPPIKGGEFMQVDRNGDIISNLVANFYRKFQDTEGLALFRCKLSLKPESGRFSILPLSDVLPAGAGFRGCTSVE